MQLVRAVSLSHAAIACSLLWGWSPVSRADMVVIPELGIQIAGLPDNLDKPRVVHLFDGYSASLRIRTANLTLSRLEEPVPSDSDIQDVNYRAKLERDTGRDLGANAHGRATAVNARHAWTTFAIAPGPNEGRFSYSSTTFVIVDQHLYWFVASAFGGDKRPADFDATLQAISDLKFVPVDRSSMPETAPAGLLRKPHYSVPNDRDWYPSGAKFRQEQGTVEFEYRISAKGHAVDVQQGEATSRAFIKEARKLVESIVFQVGPGWEERGYDKVRFLIEIQYWFRTYSRPCPEAVPPKIADADVVSICGGWVR